MFFLSKRTISAASEKIMEKSLVFTNESLGNHSGIDTPSSDSEDLRWLIEHFWSKERGLR